MPDEFLLIDDDAAFRQVLSRALERRGFRVFSCETGEQALSLLQVHQPQYGVLDLRLVETSGLQLLPDLIQAAPTIRIVVLTGYASIATAVEAIKRGAYHYLSKPATIEDILKAVGAEHAEEPLAEEEPVPMSVDRLEWEHLQRVLSDHEGNISATARSLGMHRRTLQRKLQKRPVKR